MIPSSGSITMTGSTTITTTNLTGTLTGTTVIPAAPAPPSFLLLVTTTPPAALDGIRTSPSHLFINNNTNFPVGTRIIAKRSPELYAVSGFSWVSNVLTMTVATLPLTLVSSMKVTLSGLSLSILNVEYEASASGQGATTIKVPLTTNPATAYGAAWATGLTGFACPGIVDTTAGTGNGAIGYYTVNRSPTLAVTGGTISTTTRTPVVIPAGTSHNFPLCSTTTTAFGNIILDGIGTTSIPCTQLLGLTNLRGGRYCMASGSGAAVDVLTLHHAVINPNGSGG